MLFSSRKSIISEHVTIIALAKIKQGSKIEREARGKKSIKTLPKSNSSRGIKCLMPNIRYLPTQMIMLPVALLLVPPTYRPSSLFITVLSEVLYLTDLRQ